MAISDTKEPVAAVVLRYSYSVVFGSFRGFWACHYSGADESDLTGHLQGNSPAVTGAPRCLQGTLQATCPVGPIFTRTFESVLRTDYWKNKERNFQCEVLFWIHSMRRLHHLIYPQLTPQVSINP